MRHPSDGKTKLFILVNSVKVIIILIKSPHWLTQKQSRNYTNFKLYSYVTITSAYL